MNICAQWPIVSSSKFCWNSNTEIFESYSICMSHTYLYKSDSNYLFKYAA